MIFRSVLAFTLAIAFLFAPIGCASILPALVRAAQIGQWLAGVVDAAERAADLWLATSPDPALAVKIKSALTRCRLALRALDEAVLAAQAGKDADVEGAKVHVAEAYAALYDLLEGVGALSSSGQIGASSGSEELPTPSRVEELL